MDFFLKHPEYIQQKQQRGYAFVRNCGTNEYAVSLVLQRLAGMVP
jgi:hypothetical protein